MVTVVYRSSSDLILVFRMIMPRYNLSCFCLDLASARPMPCCSRWAWIRLEVFISPDDQCTCSNDCILLQRELRMSKSESRHARAVVEYGDFNFHDLASRLPPGLILG